MVLTCDCLKGPFEQCKNEKAKEKKKEFDPQILCEFLSIDFT